MRYPVRLLLTSVPHSGTQFFHAVIRPNNLEHVMSPNIQPNGGQKEAEIIACAIRKPEDVWRSWWNRKEWVTEDGKAPGPTWFRAWECLAAMDVKIDYYLPIDHSSRQSRLDQLAARLGRAMKPDWSRKINRFPRHLAQPPEIDFEWIYSIPIVKELYGNGP